MAELLEWLEPFLATNVGKLLVIALGAVVTGILYLIRRRIEKPVPAPTDEVTELHNALILKEKLDQKKMSIEDLRVFRARVLNKPAQVAALSAEHYMQLAERLSDTSDESNWSGASLDNANTQGEMNKASELSAAAVDKALSKIVGDMLSASEPREREALVKTHNAWTVWRDAELARISLLYEDASVRPLLVNSQYEAITRERIASLQTDLLSPEGASIVNERLPTPNNLLDHVRPGAPAERVRKWLGAPTSIHGAVWTYRYLETQVQMSIDDKDVVSQIVVALVNGHIYNGTGASWGSFVLGKMTMADAQEDAGGIDFQYLESMRTKEIFINVRVGPGGAWSETACGALRVLSGAGALADADFEWDIEKSALKSDPHKILVNWIGMPMQWPNPPSFDWFIEA